MESYARQNGNYSYIITDRHPQRNLVISETQWTPRVIYSPEKEYLMIGGKSIPENAPSFYDPIINYIYQYKITGKKRLCVHLNMEYFNTSSAKCLYNLFRVLNILRGHEITVIINWFYEDEDLLEAGEDFASFFNLNFNILPLE